MWFPAAISRKIGSLFFIVAFSSALGCGHLNHDLPPLPDPGLPEHVEISSVPFHPQEAYQCGPAALAMVLQWAQAEVRLQELLPEVYTPARQGSLQPALISAARHRNRLAYGIASAEALLQELAAGHPVIVLQNLGLHWFPRWHYAVVIGYDLKETTVILHSGREARRQVNWSLFVRTWQRADYWGLVVLPVGKLPASADEKSYLTAVLGLEEAGQWEGAAVAYSKALEQWTHSTGALMGLGNSRYAIGDLTGAERTFRRAIEADPQNGAAFNNLAHVLAEQGYYTEALEMVRRAIALGGSNDLIYRQTLDEIKKLQDMDR
jgi:tetratricopeptide (TPR) repeat protein